MMNFNSKEFERFRAACTEALKPIGEEFQLSIDATSIKYGDNSFTLNLECRKTDADDMDKAAFERDCALFGFAAEDYQKTFVYNRNQYALIGFSRSSPKYPILCKQLDNGKTYKLTEETVKRAMSK